MKKYSVFLFSIFWIALLSCSDISSSSKQITMADDLQQEFTKGTFGYDLNFLKKYHKDLVLLEEEGTGAKVIVLPAYQGRVMTSSAQGNEGISFGWVNHDFIAEEKKVEHFNVFGGEERFWMGPEGGQFSIYFKKGVEFKFDNWYVPKEIDTEPFNMLSSSKSSVSFEKEMHLVNYSGNQFDLKVNRSVSLLNKTAIETAIGIALPEGVQAVAFESNNSITNIGKNGWDKNTGMLSIWILSMLNATEQTTVAVPYQQGDIAQLGKVVTDDYFGKVPAERLKVQNGIILFKADAKYRSKIGLSPSRALPLVASYDSKNKVLTIAQFTLPKSASEYVNSLWEIQQHPFSGDAVNAYNDGPIEGKQMGQFYELESSSPAASLNAGETIHHLHRTIHLKGDKMNLDKIAIKLLGIGVDAIN
jgi:hypothetical protein